MNPEDMPQLIAGAPGGAAMMAVVQITSLLIINIAAFSLVACLVGLVLLFWSEMRSTPRLQPVRADDFRAGMEQRQPIKTDPSLRAKGAVEGKQVVTSR